MRLLTKFWMVTPVGELQFNRRNAHDWEMSPTKGGFETRYAELKMEEVTSKEVIKEFGWPMMHEKFKPYGEVYEEVGVPIKKVEPLITLHGLNKVWATTRGGDTLIFESREKVQLYLEQQGEK